MAHTPEKLSPSPTATTFEVAEILEMAQAGKLRIPHFQRPFRWAPRDVHKLLDSIIRGYPIGNILLWKRPARSEQVRFGSLRFDASARQDALWVVDGQQRIVSLLESLVEQGQQASSHLAYDLAKAQLVSGTRGRAAHAIPLPQLFDLTSLMLWMSENPDAQQYLHAASEVAKSIRQYKVPAYVVESDDEDVLKDVFDRINSAGKPLKRSDVFQALNSSASDESRRQAPLHDLAERVHAEAGFGLLPEDMVLTALLATRHTDPFGDERQEFGNYDSYTEAIAATERAIQESVAFLSDSCQIPHLSLLPHRFVLYVLVRLVAVSSDRMDLREKVLLRRWVWRSITHGVSDFPGGTTGLTRTLLRCVVKGETVGSNIKNLLAVRNERKSFILPESFSPANAQSKVLLCALAHTLNRAAFGASKSLALNIGTETTAKTNIVTISSLGLVPSSQLRSPGNIVVWQREESFEDYLPALEGCESLVIDMDVAQAWREGDFETAIGHRDDLVEQLTEGFVESLCEWSLPDTPSLSKIQSDLADDGDAP